jgi:hypothetical protein
MAPIGKLSLPVDEGEFELTISGEGLSVHGHLSAVTDNRRSRECRKREEQGNEEEDKLSIHRFLNVGFMGNNYLPKKIIQLPGIG